MLFLLNDRVLILDTQLIRTISAERFNDISPAFAIKLGQELYSEQPMLHREAPERARRLALLLSAKAPDLNAALFVSPAQGCRPDEVMTRFTTLPIETLAGLYAKDKEEGGLTAVQADREVWRRMAA